MIELNQKKLDLAKVLISAIKDPVVVLSDKFKVLSFNKFFLKTFKISNDKIRGKSIFKLEDNLFQIPQIENLLKNVVEKQKSCENYELTHLFSTVGLKILLLNLEMIKLEGSETLIVFSFEDITELREAKKKLDKSQQELFLRDKIAEIFRVTTEGNVFHKVLEIILNELNSKIGYFGYINENGDLVKPSLTKKIWNECKIEGKNIIFPKEEWGGLWGKSLKERKSLMANEGLNFPSGHIKIKNVMCVPMLHQSKLIGQIVIGNSPKGYSEEEIKRLESIANLISPILFEMLEKEKLKKERLKIEEKLKNSQKSLEKLKEEIDHIDKQILKELYEDGKKSLEEISLNVIKDDKTKMSHTGVKNRIKKLTKSSILKIQGNINIKKLNFREAFVLIELKDYENLKNFLKIPNKCPRIFLLATTTGNYHLIMGIVGKSLEDINYCLNKCNLLATTEVKRSEIIFSPSLEVPEFIPIDLFNKEKFKEKREKICEGCENAEFGICGKCGDF